MDRRSADDVRNRIDAFLASTELKTRGAKVVPLTGDASDRTLLPDHPRRRAVDRARAACRRDRFRLAALRERRGAAAADAAAGAARSSAIPIALGILALQDLGDVTLQAHLGAASPGRARRALPRRRSRFIEHAAAARRASWRAGRYLPYRIAFDVEKLTWELEFFAKHFLQATGARR